MSRTAAPNPQYRQAAPVKAIRTSVKLKLPEAHPKQHELITAHDRIPGLRFVVGACGTKFGAGAPVALAY